MSNALFDFLNDLTVNKTPLNRNDETQLKSYEPYMINRFISMAEIYVGIVNEINRYDVPKSVHYEYYLSFLPKRKQYFKYLNKTKDKDDSIIKILCKYFEVGKKEAMEYVNILSDEQLNDIVKKYQTK